MTRPEASSDRGPPRAAPLHSCRMASIGWRLAARMAGAPSAPAGARGSERDQDRDSTSSDAERYHMEDRPLLPSLTQAGQTTAVEFRGSTGLLLR